MTQVFLGVGSNLDREKNIRAGLMSLQKLFGELQISPIYESESVGFRGNRFYNVVVAVNTDLSLGNLCELLKKIENENGRVRTGPRYSPRTLDIDILTYGDFVGIDAGIELPRAEITQNAFVLLPLSELAPDSLHPTFKRTYKDLWQSYDKNSQVLWRIDFSTQVTATA